MEKEIRLLIVDDEDIVHKSCQRILRKENYVIETAYSAEEGLKKIENAEFDLIVSDLMMPGMGGMEFLKIIKERQLDVMVIIFTGFATAETARQALKLGAFDYIPKPFTPEEFRDVIKNALEARQENSNAQMLDLMAIVSHELKSPVAVVQTTAETLHRGYFGKLDDKQQEIVEKIIRNTRYLEDIIRSYIDLSRMEIDDMESFNKEINFVDNVLQPVLDIPEYKDNYRNMPLKIEIGKIPPVFGDPNLLKIVVTNLLNNAVKYGKDNTEILITVSSSDEMVNFSIRNEGVGISQKDIEKRLFEKFSRLKQKGTEGIKGSGLGLYICRKIMEKHGGSISVESEEGSWVMFTISMQVASWDK